MITVFLLDIFVIRQLTMEMEIGNKAVREGNEMQQKTPLLHKGFKAQRAIEERRG